LNAVAPSTKQAFIAAVECTLKTVQYTGLSEHPQVTAKRAGELFYESLHDDSDKLVHIQTLILLAIDANNHGVLKYHGGNGPKAGMFISQACELADDFSLFGYPTAFNADQPDLYVKRVIAISLGTMDLLHLIAKKKANTDLAPRWVPVATEDKKLAGGRLYWMNRKFNCSYYASY
jgi:hypothetical protein